MWNKRHANVLAKAFVAYAEQWGNSRVDAHRLKPFVAPTTWELFEKYKASNGIHLAVSVKCAIECKICPICKEQFVGSSNKVFRAVCRYCSKHPDSKGYVVAKKEATTLERFGYKHATSSPAVQEQRRQTSLERFGTTCTLNSPEVLRRNFEKYGRANAGSTPEARAKAEQTMLSLYGAKSGLSNAATGLREKGKQTMLAIYGVDNPSKSKKLQKKKVLTSRENWGTDHHMQNVEVLNRVMLTAATPYLVTTSKRTYIVQGYERFLVQSLEKKFGAKRILTQFDEGFNGLKFSDRTVYVPDFFLSSVNTYIEVKSTWTLYGGDKNWKTSVSKAKKATEKGAVVKWYVVFNRRTPSYTLLPDDWFTWPRKKVKQYVHEAQRYPLQSPNSIESLKGKTYADFTPLSLGKLSKRGFSSVS